MRLVRGDHLALGGSARRPQHRRDLDRMVAVVVDDHDAVPLAGLGEAAAHAAKARERAQADVGDAELMRDPRSRRWR